MLTSTAQCSLLLSEASSGRLETSPSGCGLVRSDLRVRVVVAFSGPTPLLLHSFLFNEFIHSLIRFLTFNFSNFKKYSKKPKFEVYLDRLIPLDFEIFFFN